MKVLTHTTATVNINQAVIQRANTLKAISKTVLTWTAITPKAERDIVERRNIEEISLIEKLSRAGIEDMTRATTIRIKTRYCCSRGNFFSSNSFCCKWLNCLSNSFCFSNNLQCSSECSCNLRCLSSVLRISRELPFPPLQWFKMPQ